MICQTCTHPEPYPPRHPKGQAAGEYTGRAVVGEYHSTHHRSHKEHLPLPRSTRLLPPTERMLTRTKRWNGRGGLTCPQACVQNPTIRHCQESYKFNQIFKLLSRQSSQCSCCLQRCCELNLLWWQRYQSNFIELVKAGAFRTRQVFERQ